jgi:fumarylacetoacetate (FAA) hydrolase family protein
MCISIVGVGATSTARMRRTILELTEWLARDNPVRAGGVPFNGTWLVPGGLSLAGGETVEISLECIGTLSNSVSRR